MMSYFQKTTHAAPLAIFRMALGLLLFGSTVRFWSKGWITELYITPKHFFPYYGFEFVQPLGEFTYVLFAVCGISALFVAIGLFYRYSSLALFLSFTYIELIDKSTYLNHYYFISMVCLLMVFLPAHTYFSVDSIRNKKLQGEFIPKWCIDSIKVFVCIVYVFAGLAKVNSDWLLEAQPLRIWLPAKNDLPIIGPVFNYVWIAYVFSWLGCLYDLSIPFLLLRKNTRLVAYFAVVTFHVLTAILFPIGMFPYIMIATALIFFSADFHRKIIDRLSSLLRVSKASLNSGRQFSYSRPASTFFILGICFFLSAQIILPVRYLAYPGELFWTEQGYRFSWRVMLMEKAGHAEFLVKDTQGRQVVVDNSNFLTKLQEKMMSTQPDMMLQYAHILRDYYSDRGFQSPQVYVDSYVTLNGRLGRPIIDPRIDLAKETDSFSHKPWILTSDNEIAGF
jgi:hypothetical protein